MGAVSLMEPSDHPWGEAEQMVRTEGVLDPSGNSWYLAGPK
jgi:hypothetical protein